MATSTNPLEALINADNSATNVDFNTGATIFQDVEVTTTSPVLAGTVTTDPVLTEAEAIDNPFLMETSSNIENLEALFTDGSTITNKFKGWFPEKGKRMSTKQLNKYNIKHIKEFTPTAMLRKSEKLLNETHFSLEYVSEFA